jgi:hypothetical protein
MGTLQHGQLPDPVMAAFRALEDRLQGLEQEISGLKRRLLVPAPDGQVSDLVSE